MKPMITTQKRVQGPSLRITVLKEKEKGQMETGFTHPEGKQNKTCETVHAISAMETQHSSLQACFIQFFQQYTVDSANHFQK